MSKHQVQSLVSRTNLCYSLLTLTLVLLNSPTSSAFFGDWGPDLAGPWCATRAPGEDCCTGRNDVCGVPILGTECYCDIFCNETAYDCCPDYWVHCHGYQVPTTTPRPTVLPTPRPTRELLEPCVVDGQIFRPGETRQDNCNKCTCELYSEPFRRYEWRCTDDVCLIRPELISAVNDGPYKWKASNYSNLWGLTLDEGVRFRLGTFLLPDDVVDMTPIRVEDDVLPESFDAREKWPNMLHPIRDQGNCASSWAHSTTAVLSDRLTIETEGAIQDELSAQHLLSCDKDGQLGCEGGRLDRAWWYLREHGVVTEQCYPYTSGQDRIAGKCLITSKQKGGDCPSGTEYKRDKRYKATPPYRIRPHERDIMKEILDNGPVQATLQVREDFFMYNRGIYSYTELTTQRREPEEYVKSGFHSVRILGWGAERTPQGDIIKYWTCANSWGPEWGENGYFRIVRGSDESRIERYVIGAWGKITGDDVLKSLLLENRRRRIKTERVRNRRRRRRRHLRNGKARRNRRRRMRALLLKEDAKKNRNSKNSSRQRNGKHLRRNHQPKKHKKNKNGKKHHNKLLSSSIFERLV